MNLTPLPPEVEVQLPETIRAVRAFYFSLPEKERERLDAKMKEKSEKVQNDAIKPSQSKFCYECGQQINRNAKFCEYCGVKQPEFDK